MKIIFSYRFLPPSPPKTLPKFHFPPFTMFVKSHAKVDKKISPFLLWRKCIKIHSHTKSTQFLLPLNS